jgi:type III secretion protein O
MTVIGSLLRIKEYREDKAELEVSRARNALAEATRGLENARRALQDCRVSCERREDDLFAGLCKRVVRLTDLDDVKLEIEKMKGDIGRHEQHVTDADETRRSTLEKLTRAREDHREATRQREKFCELDDLSGAELRVELVRAEEREAEDVALKRPDVALVEAGDAGAGEAE